ncbi:MAG: hypothetical protein ACE5H9_21240 [Anaerolineae bacterium]
MAKVNAVEGDDALDRLSEQVLTAARLADITLPDGEADEADG